MSPERAGQGQAQAAAIWMRSSDQRERWAHVWPSLSILGMTGLVFAFDLSTPRAVVGCLLYALPVLVTRTSPHWLSPVIVATTGSVLIAVGFFFAPSDPYLAIAVVNRALALLGLWVVALLHKRRLRTKAILQHNEALLEQAQQLTHVGHWDRDLDAGRIVLSGEACRIFGLWPRELSSDLASWHRQWQALIHPEDRQHATDAFQAALRGGPRYDVEYRVVLPEGGIRFVHSCAEVIRDLSGRPNRMFGTMQDITDLRHAESLLKTSETVLRTFVDHAGDAFFMHSAGGAILDVNRRACESLGYAREELIGKNPFFFDAGVLLTPSFSQSVTDHLAAGEALAFETMHRRKDGTLFPVEVRVSSFRTNGDRFAVSLARDITDRKKAEASLRLFRTLIDHSMDAIEVLDPVTGRFLDVNEQACRSHGYTRDEYLALSVADVNAGMAAQTWATLVEDVRRTGSRVVEERHRRKDGSWFPVEVNISHVYVDREYLVAVARDITARKEVEEALRRNREHLDAVIRTVEGLVWEADPQALHFTYVSPRAERLLGYPLSQWLEEESFWANHIHPEDRDHSIRHCANMVGAKRDHDLEYRMVAADGRSVWLRDLVSVVVEEDRVVALRGIMVDVTERRRLEEQLRQSQKMEAIGQLAGGVAHDFNNILTTIIMVAELATLPGGGARGTTNGADDGTRASLEQIRVAAERAAELTRRLLLVSRRQVMTPRLLDLNEVVTALASMLQRLIGEDIDLKLNLSADPRVVRADAGMLDQVILNLAVNARDAMPQGGRLEIETGEATVDEAAVQLESDATPGHCAWLSVRDTGTGIPPDLLPRIFEPFFTTKEAGRGTGLGLATVYGIVRQHRGWIRVDSQPGQGTTFRVFLPASEEAPVRVEVTPRAQPRGGHETILLVEDEEPVRLVTRTVLEQYGYQVLEAGNGPRALDVFQGATAGAGTVSLLLTDLVMPEGMTGQRLAARLREREPLLKIVYTSGYSPIIAGRELNLGPGASFLQKPFTPEILLETVRRTLDADPAIDGTT